MAGMTTWCRFDMANLTNTRTRSQFIEVIGQSTVGPVQPVYMATYHVACKTVDVTLTCGHTYVVPVPAYPLQPLRAAYACRQCHLVMMTCARHKFKQERV